jgi:phosphoglycolate phosphatase-like HAD superfamily hydrolase
VLFINIYGLRKSKDPGALDLRFLKGNMLKLIIFDEDGVLINPKDSYLSAYQKMLEHHGVQVSESEIEPYLVMGLPNEKLVAKMFRDFKIHADTAPWAHFVNTEVTSISSIGKIEVCERSSDRLVLIKKIAPLALITNSDRKFVETAMKAFDFGNLFQKVITGSDNFETKDKAILSLMRQYSIKPEEAVYVGDTVKDVEYARRAKVKSIIVYNKCSWFWNREKEIREAKPDYIVKNWDELTTLLGKL